MKNAELQFCNPAKSLSGKRDSNPRQPRWQSQKEVSLTPQELSANAIPTTISAIFNVGGKRTKKDDFGLKWSQKWSQKFPYIDSILKLCHIMEMRKITLPKKLLKRPFSYNEAVKSGLNKYILNKLIEKGEIERLCRGMYINSNYDNTSVEAQFSLAAIQCGLPSCICLLSALEYYHLTDQITNKVWIMVPQSKRVQAANLKLIRSRNPNWKYGIYKNKNYWITTLERTIVDSLLHKQDIGSSVALEALKKAVQEGKVKVGALLDMANKLQVKHRVFPYIEALA